MGHAVATFLTDGLDVRDLISDTDFASRPLRSRDGAAPLKAVQLLAEVLATKPDTLLQELINAAVEICGADSAGFSVETHSGRGSDFFTWVATAGEYAKFLNAMLPRVPSACGICLDRGTAQLFRIEQYYFDRGGFPAPAITDGILLPWEVDESRGTIWILAHGRTKAFDIQDYQIMELLKGFAATAVRQQNQHAKELQEARAQGEAAMASRLSQTLRTPLQSMATVANLAERSRGDMQTKLLAGEMTIHLQELSEMVMNLTRQTKARRKRS